MATGMKKSKGMKKETAKKSAAGYKKSKTPKRVTNAKHAGKAPNNK